MINCLVSRAQRAVQPVYSLTRHLTLLLVKSDLIRVSMLSTLSQVPGTSAKDVLDMVMLTQYFDTMRDIGAKNKSSAIFIPHGPAAVADVASQIRNGLMQGQFSAAATSAPDGPAVE